MYQQNLPWNFFLPPHLRWASVMWHYSKQKVTVLEGHWGSQTFANLHSNSEKKNTFFYIQMKLKKTFILTSLPWERSTSASSSKVWPKIRCLRFTSMLKTRIRKVRPQRLAGETCWKNQKRKKNWRKFCIISMHYYAVRIGRRWMFH